MKKPTLGFLLIGLVGLLPAHASAAEVPPSVTITSPNAGAFKAGHPFNAGWTSTNLPPTALLKGYLVPIGSVHREWELNWPFGASIVLFSGSVDNYGNPSYHGLSLPFALPVGDYTFTLEVIDALTRNSIASTASTGIVSILPPNDVGASIKVITPNGGETYTDSVPVQISFESVNAPVGSTVEIWAEEVIDGEVPGSYLIGSITNGTSGTMTWRPQVFRQRRETYKIGAYLFAPFAPGSENFHGAILFGDSSDGAVTLNMPFGTTRSLVITAPTGTNILQAGRSYPITWKTTSISPDAQIWLSYSQFGIGRYVIAIVSNSGSYVWTVPASTSPAQWRIEAYGINEYGVPGAYGESAYFTITPPLILKNLQFVGANADMNQQHFQMEVRNAVKGQRYRLENSEDLKLWDSSFPAVPNEFEAGAENFILEWTLVPPNSLQFFRIVEVVMED